jgi:F-type H+-transporting ATPase subunit a
MFFSLGAVQVGEYLSWNIAGLAVHGQVLLFTFFVIALLLAILPSAKEFQSIVGGTITKILLRITGGTQPDLSHYRTDRSSRRYSSHTYPSGWLGRYYPLHTEPTNTDKVVHALKVVVSGLIKVVPDGIKKSVARGRIAKEIEKVIGGYNSPIESAPENVYTLLEDQTLSRDRKLLTKLGQNTFLFWRLADKPEFSWLVDYLIYNPLYLTYLKLSTFKSPDGTRPEYKNFYRQDLGKTVNGTGQCSVIPSRLQMVREGIFEYIASVAEDQLGDAGSARWLPFLGTTFIFIFVSNWLGAFFPWKLVHLPEGELTAPTSDINVTVALSLLVCISYLFAGLRAKGLGFFARYVSPVPGFLPINILEDFAKPLSLSFRLFGNVLADEIVLSVLCLLVPLLLPLPAMLLGFFSGSVQALVFSTLVGVYIWESID